MIFGITDDAVFLEGCDAKAKQIVLPLRVSLAMSSCASPRFASAFGTNGNLGYLQRLAKAYPNRALPSFLATDISDKAKQYITQFDNNCLSDMTSLKNCEDGDSAINLISNISNNVNDIFSHNVYSNGVDPTNITRILSATRKPNASKGTILASVSPFIESVCSIFPAYGNPSFMSALYTAVER